MKRIILFLKRKLLNNLLTKDIPEHQPMLVQPPQPEAPTTGERSVESKIGGNTYLITSDDDYLQHVQGEFEPAMVTLFKSLITPGDLVLDIGANVGCTSILFGDLAAQVYSFEPSPSTYVYLERNVRAAGHKNVTPVNLGLGKKAGSFELTFAKNNRSGGFVSDRTSASKGHQVEQINIVKGDDFVSEKQLKKVDFIKIDVEGFEKNVIEGLSDTITQSGSIVTLELNHWCLNAFQRLSVPDFFDFLRNIFPYLYAVDDTDVRNLHNPDDAYHVMYYHIAGGFKYPNLVGAFDKKKLEKFASTFDIKI